MRLACITFSLLIGGCSVNEDLLRCKVECEDCQRVVIECDERKESTVIQGR